MKKIVLIILCAILMTGCKNKQNNAESADQTYEPNYTEEETEMNIENATLTDEFVLGMDVSSVLALEQSGVKYYDFDGNEADVLKIYADAGIDHVRIRVWNDPYDEDGNGYGGGNNDLETAILLGKRATDYGMKVCIDFHYSDFWADPKRQHAPKTWAGMDFEQKENALYEYTKDSLEDLFEAGVDVDMVQIGNEINYGMCDETFQSNVNGLLRSGSKAVREVAEANSKDIKIIVHYTDVKYQDNLYELVKNLKNSAVDYDMIGLSYYPFWDTDFDGLTEAIEMIREDFQKDVIIVETSYCYTMEDGDGFANSLGSTSDLVAGYPATCDGQYRMISDVIHTANNAGALGVFYWEGAWIPVSDAGFNDADDEASELSEESKNSGSDSAYEVRAKIWETYGSGWASSYAKDYDPDDAGKYYGGSSWDNQAFFDFEGRALKSLTVFSDVR